MNCIILFVFFSVAFAFTSSLKHVMIQIKVGFDELPHSKFLQIFFFFCDVADRKIDVNTDFIIYLFLK